MYTEGAAKEQAHKVKLHLLVNTKIIYKKKKDQYTFTHTHKKTV